MEEALMDLPPKKPNLSKSIVSKEFKSLKHRELIERMENERCNKNTKYFRNLNEVYCKN
jgi:hypothetical protein